MPANCATSSRRKPAVRLRLVAGRPDLGGVDACAPGPKKIAQFLPPDFILAHIGYRSLIRLVCSKEVGSSYYTRIKASSSTGY